MNYFIYFTSPKFLGQNTGPYKGIKNTDGKGQVRTSKD